MYFSHVQTVRLQTVRNWTLHPLRNSLRLLRLNLFLPQGTQRAQRNDSFRFRLNLPLANFIPRSVITLLSMGDTTELYGTARIARCRKQRTQRFTKYQDVQFLPECGTEHRASGKFTRILQKFPFFTGIGLDTNEKVCYDDGSAFGAVTRSVALTCFNPILNEIYEQFTSYKSSTRLNARAMGAFALCLYGWFRRFLNH